MGIDDWIVEYKTRSDGINCQFPESEAEDHRANFSLLYGAVARRGYLLLVIFVMYALRPRPNVS